MPTPDFSNAPNAARARRECDELDAIKANIAGPGGAAARFRRQHGHLSDFIISELKLGNDYTAVLSGFGPSFALAIVTACLNSPVTRPEELAKLFVKRLIDDVRGQFDRLKDGRMNDAKEGFITVEGDKITDTDFRTDLAKQLWPRKPEPDDEP
jgi:hypothetical protein